MTPLPLPGEVVVLLAPPRRTAICRLRGIDLPPLQRDKGLRDPVAMAPPVRWVNPERKINLLRKEVQGRFRTRTLLAVLPMAAGGIRLLVILPTVLPALRLLAVLPTAERTIPLLAGMPTARQRESLNAPRKCPGCNVPVAPGYIFKNCNMCRVSVCEGCFLPLTSTCAKCNAIMNRTGALPASVFGPTAGQMGRTGLPTEASRCRDITLDPEPTAPTLSRWLTALKEAARNAFTYDCTCALSWVRSAEDAKSLDDLDVLCDYPALDARLSSALRACTQSPALKSRIDKLTAESRKNPRLGFPSTKIIWCIIDHHRASVQGQETVLIGELFRMKIPLFREAGKANWRSSLTPGRWWKRRFRFPLTSS